MLGIFKQNNGTKDLEYDPTYLPKELGIVLRAKQDASTIKAISKPEDFIKERSKEIGKLFGDVDAGTGAIKDATGKVSVYFKDRMAEYETLGLPHEMALKMAQRSAQRFYEDELELLEIAMPGYSQSFSTASVEHNATLAKNDIAGNDFDKKAYKKKLKKKMKAKYSK